MALERRWKITTRARLEWSVRWCGALARVCGSRKSQVSVQRADANLGDREKGLVFYLPVSLRSCVRMTSLSTHHDAKTGHGRSGGSCQDRRLALLLRAQDALAT